VVVILVASVKEWLAVFNGKEVESSEVPFGGAQLAAGD
jgi:hypothetical protein